MKEAVSNELFILGELVAAVAKSPGMADWIDFEALGTAIRNTGYRLSAGPEALYDILGDGSL